MKCPNRKTFADPNWNVVATTNASGTAQERMRYDAFGRITWLNASFAAKADTDFAWNRTFTGQVFDAESGLMLYRNRYYHSGLGRFISRDPIGYNAGDVSLYRYVFNGPKDKMDSLGFGVYVDKKCVLSSSCVGAIRKTCLYDCICDKSKDDLTRPKRGKMTGRAEAEGLHILHDFFPCKHSFTVWRWQPCPETHEEEDYHYTNAPSIKDCSQSECMEEAKEAQETYYKLNPVCATLTPLGGACRAAALALRTAMESFCGYCQNP